MVNLENTVGGEDKVAVICFCFTFPKLVLFGNK